MVKASFGANDKSYLTAVLAINEKNNTLFLDYGSKEDLNRLILNANKIIFETEYNGIKVSFTGAALKKVTYENESAFSMPIPKSLFWMERREFFRVKPPISKSNYCQLFLENNRAVSLRLYDISLTGFSMFNTSKEISDQLVAGDTFKQCKLILSDTLDETISFETRYKYITKAANKTQKAQKIGCKFIELPRQVENAIQAYMQKIQREELQVEQQESEKNAPYKKKIIIYTIN